jgi:hypothetical protein
MRSRRSNRVVSIEAIRGDRARHTGRHNDETNSVGSRDFADQVHRIGVVMSMDDDRFKLAYAREKFGQALHELATEPGSPQEWLRAAWLRFATILPNDLPAGELRNLFVEIRNDLTSEVPFGKEGRVAATLRKMSDEDAFELVDRIVGFYKKLRDAIE